MVFKLQTSIIYSKGIYKQFKIKNANKKYYEWI